MVIDILPDNMLTVSEVAKVLHVHPNTLRRWADKGIIRSYSITSRGDRRFMVRDINQFLTDMHAESKKDVKL
jgi:excisionase family DNA binding protein